MVAARKRAAANRLTPSVEDRRLSYRDDEIIRKEMLPEVDVNIIPPKLFTVWHSNNLPPHMVENVQHIRASSPDIEVDVYDFDRCRVFLEKYFTHEVLFAWAMLKPSAYKSDLWRYCVLYVFGGTYIDIKFRPINGFIVGSNTEEIYIKDRPGYSSNGNGIINGFMSLKPRNMYMLLAIKQIVINCHIKYYGDSSLSPTGPNLLSCIFPIGFKCDGYFDVQEEAPSNIIEYIYYKGNKILQIYESYRREQTIYGESYNNLYTNKDIYIY